MTQNSISRTKQLRQIILDIRKDIFINKHEYQKKVDDTKNKISQINKNTDNNVLPSKISYSNISVDFFRSGRCDFQYSVFTVDYINTKTGEFSA
ncbi:MAG: hypothetical protein LBE70_04325 [Nitrososphaerota archaeon]|jgi:GTP cyclohydrolase II|nr:hypothetical protein [Nitrososphaerota archaeon]